MQLRYCPKILAKIQRKVSVIYEMRVKQQRRIENLLKQLDGPFCENS